MGAFAHTAFRLFFSARLLSILAVQMQGLAIGWQVYEITGNYLDLGFVGLAQFLPAILLSLVTGHVADRFPRKRVVLTCHAAMATASAALFVLASTGVRRVASVYAVLVAIGTVRAFLNPANQAILADTVPEDELANAVALGSSIVQGGLVAGPWLGGVLYGVLHAAAPVYALSTLSSTVSLVLVAFMRPRPPTKRAGAPTFRTLIAGVEYVWRHKVLLGAISLDLFAVLLGGAVALLPAYAKDILHVNEGGFGLLRGAPAVGALVTAIVLAKRPLRRRAGPTMFACVAIFGVATIVFGASKSFPLSLAALFVVGASDMVSVFVRLTLVQLRTPTEMRGRVSAVNMVFIGASNELGEFESGVTAAWMGAVPAVIAGGIGTLVVVLLWSWMFPSLRRTDTLEDEKGRDTLEGDHGASDA
jgi:MFS family permease